MNAAIPSFHSGESISMARFSSPMFLAVVKSLSPHNRTAIFDCATARGPSSLNFAASVSNALSQTTPVTLQSFSID